MKSIISSQVNDCRCKIQLCIALGNSSKDGHTVNCSNCSTKHDKMHSSTKHDRNRTSVYNQQGQQKDKWNQICCSQVTQLICIKVDCK